MAAAKRVAEVESSELLSEDEVASRLGLSVKRVRWLTTNGHLRRGITFDRASGGLTRESVEKEEAWRRRATVTQRLRRSLGYAFFWMP